MSSARGSNQPFATPSEIPIVFLSIIEAGGGVILPGAIPWQPASTRKRFYAALRLIRDTRGHYLGAQAAARWRVTVEGAAVVCGVAPRRAAARETSARLLAGAGLGENPDPKAP